MATHHAASSIGQHLNSGNVEMQQNNDSLQNISQHISMQPGIGLATQHILRTKIAANEICNGDTVHSSEAPHQACVCVVCDRFIHGTNEIHWISKKILLEHKHRLNKSAHPHQLPNGLCDQYKVNDPDLHDLLLSRRARHRDDNTFMCCDSCKLALRPDRKKVSTPPKFAISNGWAIGELPDDIAMKVMPIMAVLLAPICPYSYLVSFIAGQHKSIKGTFPFFNHNVGHAHAALNDVASWNNNPNVYVVLSGRFTLRQREIVRNQCRLNIHDFNEVLKWLKTNNPSSFLDINLDHDMLWPIIIEDPISDNNTDTPEDPHQEEMISYEYYFPSTGEPNTNTGVYDTESAFASAIFREQTPTMIFYPGEFNSQREIEIQKICPIQFPFGFGGVTDARPNPVSKLEALRHYTNISLPQLQKSDFLLIVSHMYHRLLSSSTAFARCKLNRNGLTTAEHMSQLTAEELENAARHTTRPTPQGGRPSRVQSFLNTIKVACQPIGYMNEAAHAARARMFSLWYTFGPPSLFFTFSPCDECSFHVHLFAKLKPHHLPSLDMTDEECIAEWKYRSKVRLDNPGACAREFEIGRASCRERV
jgi:hypothetical protein